MVSLTHWLLLSAGLFSIALYGILTRRNAVGVLMAIEIALNSAALNFVAVERYRAQAAFDGQIMAMFIIAVAAAEVVAAVAIFLVFYRSRKTVNVTEAARMSG